MKNIHYIFAILFCLTACKEQKKTQLHAFKGRAFGTYYVIKTDIDTSNKTELKKGIDSVIGAINHSLNTYIPNSAISKINKGDTTVVTDQLFKDVFLLSQRINKESDGYFDPTVGNLRNAYGFGDTKPINALSEKQLDSLMQYVGWQKVQLLPDGRVRKQHPEIYFDFNAIAKGYAVDKIVEYLILKNRKHISVEIGGEVRVYGKNIDKNAPWLVGIERVGSKATNRTLRDVVQLDNQAIAGSGNFRKKRTDPVSGKHYVHTINPLTGKAKQGDILSAYVIATTCAEADAYATTLMAMDIEQSKQFLKLQPKVEAYLVYSDKTGNIKTHITEGFQKNIQ